MAFTKINTEGHISLNGYEYDSQCDRIINNEVFEEARTLCGEMFVENMKDDLFEGFEPICKGDDGNIYTVKFWGDRPVMWQRLKKIEGKNEKDGDIKTLSSLINQGNKDVETVSLRSRELTIDDFMELLGTNEDKEAMYVVKRVLYTDYKGWDEWFFGEYLVTFEEDEDKWDAWFSKKSEYGGGIKKTYENQFDVFLTDEELDEVFDQPREYVASPLYNLKKFPLCDKKRTFIYKVTKYRDYDAYKEDRCI